MIRDYYARYIKDVLRLSERTVNHYLGAINSLNRILCDNRYPIIDLYKVSTMENLESIESFLNLSEEYNGLNSRGNNMYSAALHNLMKFASADMFRSYDIFEALDFPVEVSEPTIVLQTRNNRKSIIKDQVIHAAHFSCECDTAHISFTSNATLQRYVEGHHLIPLQRQGLFPHSLDVYANVVSLCPNCHRLLHLAVKREKQFYLDRLFDNRKDRLTSSGIDISRNEFLRLTL
jgi:5-methylcytosine-specific restriction protein A